MSNRGSGLALGVALVAAFYFAGFVWVGTRQGTISYDIYAYYLPNMVYAVQRLLAGGSGLLWNPFQNCGQPFFGISSTGLLYPTSIFFLLLDADTALYAATVFNLTVAGVSAYALARELGVGRTGALAGALAFELGNTSFDLNSWHPMYGAGYAWLPALVLGCERVLREPSLRRGAQLGVIGGFALLGGNPQLLVFAYQLIALRVLWALAARQVTRPAATLRSLLLGLALPPLLVAVQFFPAAEMTSVSVRSVSLTLHDILGPTTFLDWATLSQMVSRRQEIFNPLLAIPCLIASWSLVMPRTRRAALFYLSAALIFASLSFGLSSPLFHLYLYLPFGRTFREPMRFLWVVGFCLAVMTALGIEAIRSRNGHAPAWRRGLAFGLAGGVAVAGFRLLSPVGLWPLEWVLIAVVLVCGVLSVGMPLAPRWAPLIAVGGLILNLVSFPLAVVPGSIAALAVRPLPFRKLLPSSATLFTHRELFEVVREHMTAQDRAYLVYRNSNVALMAKDAQLFGVPAIQDYEPQPTRRSAEYAVMMRTGIPMKALVDFYYLREGRHMLINLRRRLLDLAAARYVVVEAGLDVTKLGRLSLDPRFIARDRTVNVYENPQALPRAFYVTRVELENDPQALLARLAESTHDARRVALVEGLPPTGFTGVPGEVGDGSVEFLVNDPEHLVLRVNAPARGFLHLGDQQYPGWRATVNGVQTPILAANFLFRLVEVPAGESLVVFRYAPMSLRLGAAVSALTIVAVAFLLRLGTSVRAGRAS